MAPDPSLHGAWRFDSSALTLAPHPPRTCHYPPAQVSAIRFAQTRYQLGTGLLSVMGTSFTFLPITQAAIAQMVS